VFWRRRSPHAPVTATGLNGDHERGDLLPERPNAYIKLAQKLRGGMSLSLKVTSLENSCAAVTDTVGLLGSHNGSRSRSSR